MKRIVIGVPSHGDWKASFGIALSQMCMATLKHGDKEVSVVGSIGSMLSKQRHDLVMAARAQEATHLLFLDSDIIFPDDALDQLLFWDKPVVGASYPTKTIPSMPTTRKWKNNRWEFVFTNKKSEDLERVDRLPTGCLLVEMGVFEQIRQPWFEFTWTGEEDLYQGEDWGFCERIDGFFNAICVANSGMPAVERTTPGNRAFATFDVPLATSLPITPGAATTASIGAAATDGEIFPSNNAIAVSSTVPVVPRGA